MNGALGFDMAKTFIVATLAGVAISIGLFALIDSFIPKSHCVNCDYKVETEYCPKCGTSTDTVNKHNYWNRK